MDHDFYEFEQPQKPRGPRVWPYIIVLICGVLIGAVALFAINPGVFSSGRATPTPTAQQTQNMNDPDRQGQQNEVPSLGGDLIPIIGSDNPVPQIAENISRSVVTVCNKVVGTGMTLGAQDQSTGSGIIISADGYIVTNNHVIEGADAITVLLTEKDGTTKEVEAALIGSDSRSDLAVIKIDQTGLTAAPLGDSDIVRAGELAIAIGSPLGKELAGTVTVGFISAVNRSVTTSGGAMTVLQTDAAINPGNSGGALVNAKGQVIGINTMKSIFAGYSQEGEAISAEGIGFAIPINVAKPIIEELIRSGYIKRPWIGISGGAWTEFYAQRYSTPVGVLVTKVWEGTPAAEAGLAMEDIITKIDGQAVEQTYELSDYCATKNVGDEVVLSVYRHSEKKEIQVTVKLAEYHEYEKLMEQQQQQQQQQPQQNGTLPPWFR